MKEISLCLLFTFCFTMVAICQVEMPVSWTVDAEVSDDFIIITYTADIDKNWFVYSQDMEAGIGPIPTSINLETEDLDTVGDILEIGDKIQAYDDYFEMDITKYEETLSLVQKIKNNPGLKNIKGYIEFMTCDSQRCLPPANIDFDLEVN